MNNLFKNVITSIVGAVFAPLPLAMAAEAAKSLGFSTFASFQFGDFYMLMAVSVLLVNLLGFALIKLPENSYALVFGLLHILIPYVVFVVSNSETGLIYLMLSVAITGLNLINFWYRKRLVLKGGLSEETARLLTNN